MKHLLKADFLLEANLGKDYQLKDNEYFAIRKGNKWFASEDYQHWKPDYQGDIKFSSDPAKARLWDIWVPVKGFKNKLGGEIVVVKKSITPTKIVFD